MFNLWFRSTLVNLSRFYCLLGSFPSSFRISETVPLNNSFFGIFRVALLFICQGTLQAFSALQPFQAFVLSSAATVIILSHVVS